MKRYEVELSYKEPDGNVEYGQFYVTARNKRDAVKKVRRGLVLESVVVTGY